MGFQPFFGVFSLTGWLRHGGCNGVPPSVSHNPSENGNLVMTNIFKWVAAPVLAVALSLTTDAPTADAGGFSIRIGGYPSSGGFGYGRGVGGFSYSSFNSGFGYNSYRPSYRPSFGSFYGVPTHPVPVHRYGRSYYPRGPRVQYRAPIVVPRGINVYRGGYYRH